MSIPCCEIEVNELARFLYTDNNQDAVIELSLGGIEDNKDLFYFCLDLFCKGLVMLFGDNNKLVINNITTEQFESIKRKMGNAGIQVDLAVLTFDRKIDIHDDDGLPEDLPASALYPNINIKDIELLPNSLSLTDYKFEINLSPTLTYQITFNLFHKTV